MLKCTLNIAKKLFYFGVEISLIFTCPLKCLAFVLDVKGHL